MRKSMKSALAFMTAVGVAGAMAGCTSGGGGSDGGNGNGGGGGGEALTIWTLEGEPNRMAIANEFGEQFTEETGIEVEFVATDENQLPTLMTSAAAAGELPDVVAAAGLSPIRILSANGLVNTDAHAQVVENLGEDTFAPAALELTQEDGEQVAVPIDAFPILVFYRTDLFEAAGLEPPTTYEAVLAAAEALHSDDVAGIITADGPIYQTMQNFELVALANGCEMVDDAGEIVIDSPQCVEAFDFYGTLVRDYSVPGAHDSTTTREIYSAGDAAMTFWASYYLDELAGLIADLPTTCDECQENPAYLAENSGVLTSFQGPSASEPTSVGEVTSFVITSDADVEASTQFVEYFMSDAYVNGWLAQAPEGKFPARPGNQEDPEQYLNEWRELETGVDTRAPLSDFYEVDVIDGLLEAADGFERWGFKQGQGPLLGGAVAELPIANAIASMKNGELTAEEAAQQAAEELRAIQGTLQ